MADKTAVVHVGENSPEKVALDLFHIVTSTENRGSVNRKYRLDTYAECLETVKNPHARL